MSAHKDRRVVARLSDLNAHHEEIVGLANSSTASAQAYAANPILFLTRHGFSFSPEARKQARRRFGHRMVKKSLFMQIFEGKQRLPWITNLRIVSKKSAK